MRVIPTYTRPPGSRFECASPLGRDWVVRQTTLHVHDAVRVKAGRSLGLGATRLVLNAEPDNQSHYRNEVREAEDRKVEAAAARREANACIVGAGKVAGRV